MTRSRESCPLVTVVSITGQDASGIAEAKEFDKVAFRYIRKFFDANRIATVRGKPQRLTCAADRSWPGDRDDAKRIVAVAEVGSGSQPALVESIRADLHKWLAGKRALWQFSLVTATAESPQANDLGVFHFGYPDFLIPYGCNHEDNLCRATPEFVFVGGLLMRPPRDTQEQTICEALAHGWNAKRQGFRNLLPIAGKRSKRVAPQRIGPRVRFHVPVPSPELADVVAALRTLVGKINDEYAAGLEIIDDPPDDETPHAEEAACIVVTSDRSRPEYNLERVILLCEEPPQTGRYGLCFFEQRERLPDVRKKPRNMIVAPKAQWARWAEYVFLSWLPVPGSEP